MHFSIAPIHLHAHLPVDGSGNALVDNEQLEETEFNPNISGSSPLMNEPQIYPSKSNISDQQTRTDREESRP